ncbi:alpha/beta fold hydrolase [Anaeromicropila herbilytica]|uniref:2-hydroxy-6-oxo-6-phenylhexa-2,4-dienoate hydrolase n=1 Tax=Anaeromicropila herbilytica TaxID=2785025 RepID=A0A7R7IB67_9FIRM|nr:alpha/beta hydrolase [Anaeromicropila herbilytica]BCN29212.1 2-hydroxy-6-oxo-6-phenylhexa-2,4-dienoate hydrolase [Anaeromicropila herbilytica]
MSQYMFKDTIIDYERVGVGIPILFLHGWGMDRRIMSGCFEPIFQEFQDTRGLYSRIYIDLPGMGKSHAGPSIKNSDDILEILHLFIKEVVCEKFILVGESYGGYLARGYINQYPDMVKAIIMLWPLVYPGYQKGRIEPLKVMQRDDEFLQTLSKEQYDSFTYMNVILTKPVWELYQKDILPAIEEQDRHFLEEVLDGACSFDVDQLDAPYMNPCLTIVGKQDTEVGYKDQFELMNQYPNATYCAINKAGHNLQIEQPELFRNIVKQWLMDIK